MHLGIVCAYHGRPGITRLHLAGVERLIRDGVDCAVYATVTEGDRRNITLLERSGAVKAFMAMPNDDLGFKFNQAAQLAECHGADAIMVLGSDDIVSTSYAREAARLIDMGTHYVLPPSLAVVQDRKAIIVKVPIWGTHLRIGAGRTIAAALLEQVQWMPWDIGINKGLDMASHNLLLEYLDPARCTVAFPTEYDVPHVLDVKSKDNIWDIDHFRVIAEEIDEQLATWMMGPEEKAIYQGLHGGKDEHAATRQDQEETAPRPQATA